MARGIINRENMTYFMLNFNDNSYRGSRKSFNSCKSVNSFKAISGYTNWNRRLSNISNTEQQCKKSFEDSYYDFDNLKSIPNLFNLSKGEKLELYGFDFITLDETDTYVKEYRDIDRDEYEEYKSLKKEIRNLLVLLGGLL